MRVETHGLVRYTPEPVRIRATAHAQAASDYEEGRDVSSRGNGGELAAWAATRRE